jgi:hypothetical protein
MLLRNVIGAVPLVFAAAIGLAQPTLQPFPLGVPPGTSSDRSIRGARLRVWPPIWHADTVKSLRCSGMGARVATDTTQAPVHMNRQAIWTGRSSTCDRSSSSVAR